MKAGTLPANFSQVEAQALIENLRWGRPTRGYTLSLTVGREEQLERLAESLHSADASRGSALLIKANYGSGKSHLLRVIREMAIEAGFAVSLVTVNAVEGVRFNRMDTIFGEICRRIEVDASGYQGVGLLFDRFAQCSEDVLDEAARSIRGQIHAENAWDYSDFLQSPALYVALRAWVNGDADVRDLVTAWLTNPEAYRSQRKLLFEQLVVELRGRFRDHRRDWQFFADDVFSFHTSGHRQAWSGLSDLDLIAKGSGYRGLVLLFDEFEDVIQNLTRSNFKQDALHNLFTFFGGNRFTGMAYFAVTPDFVSKCQNELSRRGVWDFDFKRLTSLPTFELDDLAVDELLMLSKRIRHVHSVAYKWKAVDALPDDDLRALATYSWSSDSPGKTRHCVRGVIDILDGLMQKEP